MLKTITVWGSPGSGKTTISLSLAWQLVKQKKNVVIVNTDNTVPNLPVYLPRLQTDSDGLSSIGSLIDNGTNRGNDALRGRIHLHPKSDNLGFMALTSGETPLTYKGFEKQKMLSFFKLIQSQPIDYFIVDGQSNPVNNAFTLLSFEISDKVIRTVTPDVKGVEFCKSQLRWLSDSVNINTSQHIKVANPCKPQSAVDDAAALVGGFDFILPENSETYIAFSSGEPFGNNTSTLGKEYDSEINKLCEKVMQDEV